MHIKRLILLIGLLSIVTMSVFAQQNVVVIIADDLGTDYLGFYPNSGDTANTPVLRELASNGVVFTNAWSSPVCSPARACMFTGRYAFRTGVGNVITGSGSPQLDTAEMSVARLLRDYGPVSYSTAQTGKWHLHVPNQPVKRSYPNRMGYNLYSGNFSGTLSDYYNWVRIRNGVLDTVTTYATTYTVNEAIAWLDTIPAGNPFFLWMGFNAPHSPFHKPPDSLITMPGLPGTPAHIAANPKLYYKASLEALDTEVGRLIDILDASGLLDSTNFIFIGDNGNDPRVAQVADPTHAKGSLYEYGVHVPFFAAGPAVVQPGRFESSLVNNVDIFSTVLEICGFNNWQGSIPSGTVVDSRSFLPLLKNDTSGRRAWVFTEQFRDTVTVSDGKAIRNLTHKLIRFDDGRQELYDLSIDFLEQNDLLLNPMMPFDSIQYVFLCDQLQVLTGSPWCGLTGYPEISQDVLNVWPNPSSGVFQVSLPSPVPVLFELCDVTGRVLKTGNQGAWELSGFSDGIYVLRPVGDFSYPVKRIMLSR